jgi:hypothetical protein
MSTEDEDFQQSFVRLNEDLDNYTGREKLFLLAGLIELLRHTKSPVDAFSIAKFLVTVKQTDWARIPFSITKAVLGAGAVFDAKALGVPEQHVPSVLQSGLMLFLDELNADPHLVATQELLWEHVKIAASLLAPPEEPPAHPKQPVASPEIFNARLMRRVFEPAKVTPELFAQLGLHLVNYRAELANGKLGPTLRGVAIQTAQFYVLLESGEFVVSPIDNPNLVISTAAEDFKNFSPAALLALLAVTDEFERLAVLSAEQAELIRSGSLGKLKHMHFNGHADCDDLRPLEHVFDNGREPDRMGATGPSGAIVRFPVPAAEDLAVVIEAQQDAHGPYSTARLVRENETGADAVLMRHEAPRLYSLRGVYLFPLQDRLVSLSAIF